MAKYTNEAVAFYKTFHDVDPALLTEEKLRELVKNMRAKGTVEQTSNNDDQVVTSIKLMANIARQSTEQQWRDHIENNAAPNVKLTPREMEAVRGGCISCVAWIVGWFWDSY